MFRDRAVEPTNHPSMTGSKAHVQHKELLLVELVVEESEPWRWFETGCTVVHN